MDREPIADCIAKPAAQRLRDALQAFASGNAPARPTAKALCEMAGVSRNALYRYHLEVLRELHMLQRRRQFNTPKADRSLQPLREENAELHQKLAKLASLVDHYYAAWQEASAVLQRCERELAELRRGAKPKLVTISK